MAVLLSTDSDFKGILDANEKVIVKYYADWCGTCRLFAPKFKKMAEEAAHEGITFVEVNAEKNPEARKAAGVNNLPYLAVFKGGILVEGFPTGKEEAARELLAKLN